MQSSTEDTRSAAGEQSSQVRSPVLPSGFTLPDFGRWGDVEQVRLTSIQRRTAEHLSLAWRSAPHVTHFDLADITELESLRNGYAAAHGMRPTVTAFVIKALATILRKHPCFNATLDLDNNHLIVKKYISIGLAVDTPHGLIVPVIRDADRKTVAELAVETADLADRGRRRRLLPDDLQGGTFTVTNLGAVGGTAFTPIINYPEVAILGLARSREELFLSDDRVRARRMLPLCLSYDHRIINGADGARFARDIAQMLESPRVLMEVGDA